MTANHASPGYTLFYFPSTASYAPHILLEELGVPFTLSLVDRMNDGHKSPAYLKLNPAGLIPVLVDGDLVLPETAAILMHLADQHPASGFAPALNTPERAHYTRWMFYLSNTLQAELITYFYPARLVEDESVAAQVKRCAEARVGTMLDILDAHLASHGGTHLLGSPISAADVLLYVLCRWTRNMTNPARNRPHLRPFLERMLARPAVQRATATEGLVEPYY